MTTLMARRIMAVDAVALWLTACQPGSSGPLVPVEGVGRAVLTVVRVSAIIRAANAGGG